MANSIVISDLKERVVDAIAHDDTIFRAFDAKDCENGGDLLGKYIFKYNRNPETITDVVTFMTVMVHIEARTTGYWQKGQNTTFITPVLDIWIYSHYEHMDMDYPIKDNRNDYLSMLIDEKLNGSTDFGGIGKLSLVQNTEGSIAQKFLYRNMVFKTIDVNDSFCDTR